MNNKLTPFEFACKVDWEGGVLEALLDYGLRSDSIGGGDDDLRKAWADLEDVFSDSVRLAIRNAERAVEDALEAGEPE